MREDGQVAPVEVVAIVASAGGLNAITRVLRDLPAGFPTPVLVAQHLGGQGSHLVPILAKRTGREVVWMEDGAALRPGTVAVARPRHRMEVMPDGTCLLSPFERTHLDRPLDAMLMSVADSFGARSVAVVLTGMGRDGSAGARAVHDAGGTVLVQDEETADQPALPMAAVTAGAADRVLPLHDIGRVVAAVVCGDGLPPAQADLAAARALFSDPGEVAGLARELDWSATPLGPVGEWPDALRATVGTAMRTPLASCVLWGPRQIQVYNDAYRHIMGGKHPAGLGQANRDCWPEVWHLNEEIYATVLGGRTVQLRDALYPITRSGVLEDAWFDLYFVPIPGGEADGGIGGVLCTVVEKTAQVLSSRRLRTLHDLTDRTAGATSSDAALKSAVAVLDGAQDILFAIAYRTDPKGEVASLVDVAGVEPGGFLAPAQVSLLGGNPAWPLGPAARDRTPVLVDDLERRFHGLGAWPSGLVCHTAQVTPLHDPATDAVTGFVVLGAQPRLDLDAEYREFLRLTGNEIASRVVEAQGRQRERERLERLAALDRAKTEFFSNVSHEFRTPLTLMLGPLDELGARREELPAELRADVETAGRNARRLLRLVGSLLDFSQAEASRLHARAVPTDLSALTTEIASLFRGAAERAGLELRISAPPLGQPVWLDPQMWENILSNLLSNALKFTFSGSIDVAVRLLSQHAEIEVTDTGVGVPDDELPHLFKRFHRVRGRRGRTAEGAGIGLALAHELVRRHHGRIRVRSTVGKGTTFTVWLPLGQRHGTDLEPDAAPPAGIDVGAAMAEEAERWAVPSATMDEGLWSTDAAPHLPGDRQARVLVVDDNADLRDYLERLLAPHWQVQVAPDAEQALQQARRVLPQLILADVRLPGLDGVGLLRAVRGDAALAATPVVLMSALTEEGAAVSGLLAGADDYIAKPFPARELLARVGAQIELATLRRQSEERYRALVRASWDVVYRMNADWTQMRDLDGRGFIADTESPDADWLTKYIHPDDQPEVMAAIEEAIRTRSVFQLEHRVVRTDGSLGRTLSRAVPLLDADGEIVEWVGAASDVTDGPRPLIAPR